MYFVYILKAGTHRKAPIKIGMARDVEVRIKELQTGNPYELICIGTIAFDTKEQAFDMEQFLHYVYADRRLEGEWFSVNDFSLIEAQKIWEKKAPNTPCPISNMNNATPEDNYTPRNKEVYARILEDLKLLSKSDLNSIVKKINSWKELVAFENRRNKKSFEKNQVRRLNKRWKDVDMNYI